MHERFCCILFLIWQLSLMWIEEDKVSIGIPYLAVFRKNTYLSKKCFTITCLALGGMKSAGLLGQDWSEALPFPPLLYPILSSYPRHQTLDPLIYSTETVQPLLLKDSGMRMQTVPAWSDPHEMHWIATPLDVGGIEKVDRKGIVVYISRGSSRCTAAASVQQQQ